MPKINLALILASILAVLGVIADFTGIMGFDVNQEVTIRWLLIEVILTMPVIFILIQFVSQAKKSLTSTTASCKEEIDQLRGKILDVEKSYAGLMENYKQVICDREVLRSAIHVIRVDRQVQFTDPEMAHLYAISEKMQRGREVLTSQDKLEVIQQIIEVSGADSDFREAQQIAVKQMGKRFGIEQSQITVLINEKLDELKVIPTKKNNHTG